MLFSFLVLPLGGMANEVLLKTEGLVKRFGWVGAVNGITVEIPKGLFGCQFGGTKWG